MAKITKAQLQAKAAQAEQAVEQDTAGLRAWLASLWAPVAHLFQGRLVWLLLIPAGVWFYIDRGLIKTWLSLLLAVVLTVGLAVLVRKVVMPRIDIQAAAEKAQEDPVGAALVFLGGVFLMLAVIAASTYFLMAMRAGA